MTMALAAGLSWGQPQVQEAKAVVYTPPAVKGAEKAARSTDGATSFTVALSPITDRIFFSIISRNNAIVDLRARNPVINHTDASPILTDFAAFNDRRGERLGVNATSAVSTDFCIVSPLISSFTN
jgi:hypothetical protein